MTDESVSFDDLGNSNGLDRLDAALASALFSALKPGALRARVAQQLAARQEVGRQLKGRQIFRMIQDHCAIRGTGTAVVATLHNLRLTKDEDLPVFLESWERATHG